MNCERVCRRGRAVCLQPLEPERTRPDPNLEARHLSKRSINKKMHISRRKKETKLKIHIPINGDIHHMVIPCQTDRHRHTEAQLLLLMLFGSPYLAIGRIGHLRKEGSKLAHVSKTVRQTVDVEQFWIESGHSHDGWIEPITSQRLSVVHFPVQLRTHALATISCLVFHESVTFAVTWKAHKRVKIQSMVISFFIVIFFLFPFVPTQEFHWNMKSRCEGWFISLNLDINYNSQPVLSL